MQGRDIAWSWRCATWARARRRGNWNPEMFLEADLLNLLSAAEFHENLQAGRVDQNAKLSRAQEQLISTLAKIVAKDASQASLAMGKLFESVRPWQEAKYYGVVEQ